MWLRCYGTLFGDLLDIAKLTDRLSLQRLAQFSDPQFRCLLSHVAYVYLSSVLLSVIPLPISLPSAHLHYSTNSS